MVKVVSVAEIKDAGFRVWCVRCGSAGPKSTSNGATRHPIRYIEAEIESSDDNRKRTENKVQLHTGHPDLRCNTG